MVKDTQPFIMPPTGKISILDRCNTRTNNTSEKIHTSFLSPSPPLLPSLSSGNAFYRVTLKKNCGEIFGDKQHEKLYFALYEPKKFDNLVNDQVSLLVAVVFFVFFVFVLLCFVFLKGDSKACMFWQ